MSSRNYKWTKDEEIILKENYQDKKYRELIDLLGGKFSYNAIMKKAQKLGLQKNYFTVSGINRETALLDSNRKVSINKSFFQTESDDSAYIVGLILADGCLFKNKTGSCHCSITLNNDDKYLLSEVSYRLGMEGRGIYKQGESCTRLVISSEAVYKQLKNFGIVEAKSLVARTPKLSKQFIPSFLRGVIDGDGCVQVNENTRSKRVFITTGSYDFAKDLLELFNSLGIHLKLYKRAGKKNYIYNIGTNRIKDILLIYEKLYNHASMYLHRKKVKFDKIANMGIKKCEIRS